MSKETLPVELRDKNRFPKRTVLLVDDDIYVRTTCMAILEKFGFNVLTASDGMEAVEIFCANSDDEIQLVVCDICMPGMDDWETINRILLETNNHDLEEDTPSKNALSVPL
jgi:CheY-like chemotaxis protein